MNRTRRVAAMAALAVVLCWLAAACGSSSRQKAIATTFAATDVAAHAFEAYDAKKQTEIVAQAKDKPTGQADLATWRSEQAKVEQLFAGAYRAIAAAATVDNDASLNGMVGAALILSQELKAIGALP